MREPRLKVAVQGGMDTLVVAASAGANILSGQGRHSCTPKPTQVYS
jgi:hypothetical protein